MGIFWRANKLTIFKTLVDELAHGRFNTNYKIVVYCHLASSENHIDSMDNISKVLSDNNPDKPYPYFNKRQTVFQVVSSRLGHVEKIGSDYRLKGKLNPEQILEIKKLCKKKLKEFS